MTTEEAKERGLLPADWQDPKGRVVEVSFDGGKTYEERTIPMGGGLMEQINDATKKATYEKLTPERFKAFVSSMFPDDGSGSVFDRAAIQAQIDKLKAQGILYGTPGESVEGTTDVQKMFYDPEAYRKAEREKYPVVPEEAYPTKPEPVDERDNYIYQDRTGRQFKKIGKKLIPIDQIPQGKSDAEL